MSRMQGILCCRTRGEKGGRDNRSWKRYQQDKWEEWQKGSSRMSQQQFNSKSTAFLFQSGTNLFVMYCGLVLVLNLANLEWVYIKIFGIPCKQVKHLVSTPLPWPTKKRGKKERGWYFSHLDKQFLFSKVLPFNIPLLRSFTIQQAQCQNYDFIYQKVILY